MTDHHPTKQVRENALRWLHTFEGCIQKNELERGRPLFHPEVYAFGTVVKEVDNLNELIANQWTPVWQGTSDFTFTRDSIRTITASNYSVTVTSLWSSSRKGDPRGTASRVGRCTIVLEQSDANEIGLVATHSHFSKIPDGSV